MRAAYWFVTTGGKFQFAPSEPLDIGNPAVLRRFRQGISTIAEGIRGGVFPANPGGGGQDENQSNCSYCDFNSLCLSRRVQLWSRKKNDGLLSGYLSLSAGVERESEGEDGEQ